MPSDGQVAPPAPAPVTLFYSYAHEDEVLRNELQDHLMILERRHVIRSWHDRAIVPGQDWNSLIDEHLRSADVVLLLISKDFIASDYIMGAELQLAMQRHATGETVVVPILLRQVDLQPEDSADLPFVGLLQVQGLPKDLKPVTSWTNRDEAWTNVASGLRSTVKLVNARRPAVAASTSAADATARTPAGAVKLGAPVLLPMDDVFGETPAAVPDNSRLAAVCDGYSARITEAALARGGESPDPAEIRDQARRLIDLPDAKRVLWVDDHPENNRAEIAAFAGLQIEVVTVPSTAEALAALSAAVGDDRFDLVISDWRRDADGPMAGLRLIASMRMQGHTHPVAFYHGAFGKLERAALATSARAAGALGEAVMPDELMRLVVAALNA